RVPGGGAPLDLPGAPHRAAPRRAGAAVAVPAGRLVAQCADDRRLGAGGEPAARARTGRALAAFYRRADRRRERLDPLVPSAARRWPGPAGARGRPAPADTRDAARRGRARGAQLYLVACPFR